MTEAAAGGVQRNQHGGVSHVRHLVYSCTYGCQPNNRRCSGLTFMHPTIIYIQAYFAAYFFCAFSSLAIALPIASPTFMYVFASSP
jgi:hypothetical protein